MYNIIPNVLQNASMKLGHPDFQDIMPWDSDAAEAYARLRTSFESEGTPLGTMDMLIAAHSVAVGAVLVTNDQAFYNVKHPLSLEDWTMSLDH